VNPSSPASSEAPSSARVAPRT